MNTETNVISKWTTSLTKARTFAWVFLGCISILWTIEFVDVAMLDGALDRWGIVPRHAPGLWGILAAPLLHGNFEHLAGNTVGLVFFGGLVAIVGRREFIWAAAAGWLIGGLGTWVLGRPGIHIGASGVVFALFGYLLLRGWYDRKLWSVLLSAALLWGYGELLWGMVPGFAGRGISWEGHLFGFLGGVLVARVFHSPPGQATSLKLEDANGLPPSKSEVRH